MTTLAKEVRSVGLAESIAAFALGPVVPLTLVVGNTVTPVHPVNFSVLEIGASVPFHLVESIVDAAGAPTVAAAVATHTYRPAGVYLMKLTPGMALSFIKATGAADGVVTVTYLR
jgi:hypothetical protein